jgi:hypothetical protein
MTAEDLKDARTRFAREIQQPGQIKSNGAHRGPCDSPARELRGSGTLEDLAIRRLASGYQLTPDSNARALGNFSAGSLQHVRFHLLFQSVLLCNAGFDVD